MSCIMRKSYFCLCKNIGADQLISSFVFSETPKTVFLTTLLICVCVGGGGGGGRHSCDQSPVKSPVQLLTGNSGCSFNLHCGSQDNMGIHQLIKIIDAQWFGIAYYNRTLYVWHRPLRMCYSTSFALGQ